MLPLALCLLGPLLAPLSAAEARPYEVRIAALGAAGDLLVEGWTIDVRPNPRGESPGRWQTHAIDPSLGCAVIELERGRYEARARNPVRTTGSSRSFDVRSAPLDVLVQYRGVDPERALVVDLINRERLLLVEGAPVWAVRGDERVALARAGRTYRANDVAPGLWHVEVDSPRLVGWRSEPVSTGTPTRIEVESYANVRVVARDLATGLLVAEPSGKLEPGPVLLTRTGEDSPGVLVGDTLAGDAELVVSARGYTTRRLAVTALRVGEQRVVEVELEPAGSLALVVVDSGGAPVAGLGVELDWLAPLPEAGGGVPWTYVSVTGAEGDVLWHTVPPGRYVLRVAGASPVTLDLRSGARVERRVALDSDG